VGKRRFWKPVKQVLFFLNLGAKALPAPHAEIGGAAISLGEYVADGQLKNPADGSDLVAASLIVDGTEQLRAKERGRRRR